MIATLGKAAHQATLGKMLVTRGKMIATLGKAAHQAMLRKMLVTRGKMQGHQAMLGKMLVTRGKMRTNAGRGCTPGNAGQDAGDEGKDA